MRANLVNVKSVRIWLLLLLAVLVPVRGAVASAMLCPIGNMGEQGELRMHKHQAGPGAVDHHLAAEHTDHRHAAAAADEGHHDEGQGNGTSDTCNACAAYCSLTALFSEAPRLTELMDPAAVTFPDLSSPPPTSPSGRQERPPRSI